MNTKRSITALLLSVCIGVSALFAGCGGSQTNDQGKDAVSIFVTAMEQLHDGELSFSMSGKTNITGTTKYDQVLSQNADVRFEIETVDVINPTMPDRLLVKMSGTAGIDNKETMDENKGENVDSYTCSATASGPIRETRPASTPARPAGTISPKTRMRSPCGNT